MQANPDIKSQIPPNRNQQETKQKRGITFAPHDGKIPTCFASFKLKE
jgi:hypothetical protein